MRRLVILALAVISGLASAAPAHAGLNLSNHNETFLREED
jgi:hypothetical protein